MNFGSIYFSIFSGTAACATVPAWMKTAMASVTGLERIINGQQAPSPSPWQAHMRQGSPTGKRDFYVVWRMHTANRI